jgi:pimeloyl-ACP methyl ester carboxylesterase
MMRRVCVALLLVCCTAMARAAEWQWAVELPVAGQPNRPVHAWMWIPPRCERVRGLFLGEQIILEDYVMSTPVIRQAAADTCLAMVLMSRDAVGGFDYSKEKRDDLKLQALLDALAAESGYSEVATAPLLVIGHSGGSILGWHMAYWRPEHTIAWIGLHAAADHAPAWDPKGSVDGVPMLGISGEYESVGDPATAIDNHWRWLRGGLLEHRAQDKNAQMSELVDPGGGHFSFNPPMAEYVALFIRSAVAARVDDATPGKLRVVPKEAGWLTDITPLAVKSEHAPALYGEYTGDPTLAFWHLNKELALANDAYRRGDRGKQDQRVTCMEDGKPLRAVWLEDVKFAPDADGVTVHFAGGFLEKTPDTAADAGKPLGHAAGPVQFKLIGGWFGGGEQVGPGAFRLRNGHLGLTDNLFVLAYHPGDATYAYAEQACQVKFPKMNTTGAAQTIRFVQPADRAAGAGEVALEATASSGLPVEFFVVRGPAEIDGHTLKLTALPPRARFPVKVTVVAYQYGNAKTQSAVPVERSFLMKR